MTKINIALGTGQQFAENNPEPTLGLGMALRTACYALMIAMPLAVGANSGGQASEESENKGELEEVVVLGRKREEVLANVPSSVSVISGLEFDLAGGRNLRDLDLQIPNVIFSGKSNLVNNVVTIRGIGTSTRSAGLESGTAYYLDGVLLNRPGLFSLTTNDIASIEVFRGPQGTEFGRNALAGVFYTTSRRPTDQWEYEGMVGVGNYSFLETTQVISGPLSDSVGVRVAMRWEERSDGTVENFVGENPGTTKPFAVRANLSWQMAESTKLEFIANYSEDRASLSNLEFFENPELAGSFLAQYSCSYPARVDIDFGPWGVFNFGCVPVDGARTTADPLPYFQDVKTEGGQLNLDHAFTNDWSLRWITAYYENRTSFANSVTFGPDSAGDPVGSFDDDADQFSSELQFISPIGSPGDQPWDIVAGLYYFTEDLNSLRYLDFLSPVIPVGDENGFPTGEFLQILTQEGTQELDSYAIYANGNYYLNDRLTLNLGVRSSREERTAQQVQNGSIQLFIGRHLEREMKLSENVTTGTASLQYALSDDMRVYGKWSMGYKPGGTNLDTTSGSAGGIDLPATFDSEKSDLFELGLRSTLLDGQLSLNATLFYQNYENHQNTVLFPGNSWATIPGQVYGVDSPDGFIIANIGDATTKGGEFELNWQVTDSLQLRLAYGYTKAKYDSEQKMVTEFDPLVNGPLNRYISRVAGKPLPFTREHTATAGGSWTVPVGSYGYLTLSGDMGYQSPQQGPTPGLIAERQFRVDANLAFRDAKGRYQVELYGYNLTDETYLVTVVGNPLTGGVGPAWGGLYNNPPTYGLRLRLFAGR